MSSSARLSLDNHRYYPGETINGRAICYFNTTKDVRKVRVRLKGAESTSWTKTESYTQDGKTKSRTVHYSGYHDVILQDQYVHGEGEMRPGEHVFPFQFILPADLPSSFQHHHGKIYYSVKITVDRPWKTDYEDKKEIQIISPISLHRLSPSLQQPAEYSDEKTICCFCCASGPIQLDVNLEKRAFVVGENAGVKVYCMNMSNTNVDGISVEIKAKLTMKATSPSSDYQYDSELVASSHNSGVGAHGEKTYNLSVEIPQSSVIPNFYGCELFSLNTPLKVTGVVSGCHTNLEIVSDVAIGHVPYLQASQAPTVGAQYAQTVPPYPVEQPLINFQPMPMPMPTATPMSMPMPPGKPPYPTTDLPIGPSAPTELGAPSAPPKIDLGGNNPFNSGAGNFSGFEPPPPSYEEAARNLK